jgi:ketosteroid isomerase-like protein
MPGNVELVEAFFEAYNARDGEAVDRLLHPDAEITTMTARAGLPGEWSPGTTREYFRQLNEALGNVRVAIEDYREVGGRIVALGVIRGSGRSSRIELGSPFAAVFAVRDSRLVLVDSYDDWGSALESAGLSK